MNGPVVRIAFSSAEDGVAGGREVVAVMRSEVSRVW